MLDYRGLEAFGQVIRSGGFAAAAQSLGITQSAVSQRIKHLEESVGVALVIRGQPCQPTEAGRKFLHHVDNIGLLENELLQSLKSSSGSHRPHKFRIAVSSDNLSTWFLDAIVKVDNVLVDLILDDESRSIEWLKSGDVNAVLSETSQPAHGCDVTELGSLKYIAAASNEYVERWFPNGLTADALSRAPAINFDNNDRLQSNWVEQQTGLRLELNHHCIPSSRAMVKAILAGFGWAIVPKLMIDDYIADEVAVPLLPNQVLEHRIYWHYNRIISKPLEAVSKAVTDTARTVLR